MKEDRKSVATEKDNAIFLLLLALFSSLYIFILVVRRIGFANLSEVSFFIGLLAGVLILSFVVIMIAYISRYRGEK